MSANVAAFRAMLTSALTSGIALRPYALFTTGSTVAPAANRKGLYGERPAAYHSALMLAALMIGHHFSISAR
jgi:hypothetical protein